MTEEDEEEEEETDEEEEAEEEKKQKMSKWSLDGGKEKGFVETQSPQCKTLLTLPPRRPCDNGAEDSSEQRSLLAANQTELCGR